VNTPEEMKGEIQELANLDRLVHEPARLMILTYLYTLESADFVFLTNATELTWGNLSSHLSKLEEAGYVEIEKEFVGKRPRTTIRLSADGRKAIEAYKGAMHQALNYLGE
jgi:DNA-binding transcriptional ArsR family regulator